ncbi:methyltransferase-like protein 16 isoform X2 [Pseudomyrmex gracilis]|uniref:methyltransferase-like protein 16 isoform X2 n=1 Tax=Pseudomyrmex gracilis TaxID=219809 RepID=UPI000994CC7E|nr:methyltransferase-like protein 16 isoform X2 [Pseudomyrmex gracilis]XP_020284196.1 methyltransferase-like protein 16 isoform X2 [Pseudomyrmex gracilis]
MPLTKLYLNIQIKERKLDLQNERKEIYSPEEQVQEIAELQGTCDHVPRISRNCNCDNLNPAITLRMNYILWIEDLMKHSKLEMNKITGIDIGTGAICIYALLLAQMYQCHVIATEVDKKSVEYAKECVKRNNLCNLIKVILVNSDRIFKDVIEDDKFYDFSMCNPPFFESEGDDEKVEKAFPPRNAPTGNEGELKIKGGEVAFVTKMIEESIEIRDRIKIYSTMIGKKADLFQLKSLIRSKDIENLTWTEFCQGHTTRWGLAWSFLPKSVLDLGAAPVIRKSGKSMMQCFKNDYKTTITFSVEEKFSCLNDLISFLRTTMEELSIKLEDVAIPEDSSDAWVCEITAMERSWEHMRRKRRLMQRQLALKKLKIENSEFETNVDIEKMSDAILVAEESNNVEFNNSSSSSIKPETTAKSRSKSFDKESDECVPLLTCMLCVEMGNIKCKKGTVQNMFKIQMIFRTGNGGVEALQSLRQYLINKLGIRNKTLDNSSISAKKKRKRTKKTSVISIRQSQLDS